MLDPLKDLEMGITCFQLTTVQLVATFGVLLLVVGCIATTALLLLKSQHEKAGKFLVVIQACARSAQARRACALSAQACY